MLVSYKPRLRRLEEAGSPVSTQSEVMRRIAEKYNRYLDQRMFSQAFRGEADAQWSREIRKMADAILTEAEKEAGVTA